MGRQDYETETLLAVGGSFDVAPCLTRNYGKQPDNSDTSAGPMLLPIAIQGAAHRENPASGPDGVGIRTDGTAYTLEARSGMGRQDYETETLLAFSAKDHGADAMEGIAPTLRAGGFDKSHANSGNWPAVAFQSSQSGVREVESHATLDSNNGSRRHNGVIQGMAVRRLTPRECERLQGFPDDYTKISEKTADGPRYKALGNSMAVPCMKWLGQRIQMVEDLTNGKNG